MKADISEAFGSELVLLGADGDAALVEAADRLVAFIDQAPMVPLRDIAYTCALEFCDHHGAVLAVVASSAGELRQRVAAASERIRAGVECLHDRRGTWYFRSHPLGPNSGKLAYVFPGAASFYPDMLRDLAVRFREVRLAFDELEAALVGSNDRFQPSAYVFPPAPYYRHDADVFAAGGYAEAVVSTYSANAGIVRLLDTMQIRPDGVTGISGGDLNALVYGGLFGRKFDRKRRLEFLRDVYRTVNNATAHAGLPKCVFISTMAPRGVELGDVLAGFPPEKVQIAFVMAPRQMTLAVASDAIDEVQSALSRLGVRLRTLSVDRPFNTPWCEKVLPLFRKLASRWVDDKPAMPVYSCGSAEPLPPKARKARDEAAGQWVTSVRFADTIRRMYSDGYRVFLEVGPRDISTRVIDEVLCGERHIAVAVDSIHRAGLLQLQHVIGQLAACGAELSPVSLFAHRRPNRVDFSSPLAVEVRSEAEMRLSRDFPRLTLPAVDLQLGGAMVETIASSPGRRDKGAIRAAELAAKERRMRRFASGAIAPMVSDADEVDSQPGILEVVKTFTFVGAPFLADFALGTSNISYGDRSLRGLTPLGLVAGMEIMAELAMELMPSRTLVAVEDFRCNRRVLFEDGRLRLVLRAERTSCDDPSSAAVRVLLREDTPQAALTMPVMVGVFILSQHQSPQPALDQQGLSRPREVHWGRSDIYPDRLFSGRRLRNISSAARWCETGLDYEIEVPSGTGAVAHTEFPIWAINPLVMAAVTDGFSLWRSHERFPGAFSYPLRVRRLNLYSAASDGQHLKCYLRATSVTERSLITNIKVSDGNGKLAMELRGYEEIVERVPEDYRKMLLSPPTAFISHPLSPDLLGSPATPVASAVITEIPYRLFENSDRLWLGTLSRVVLGDVDRLDFDSMTGSVSRQVEWLFGRIAAKEAVRRYMLDRHQARWSGADVQIGRLESGKPRAVGPWKDALTTPVDIAIAHTSQFVVALVAANARTGVDVETIDRRLSAEFTSGVFTPEEQELAVAAIDPPKAMVRFWCAKEAVSKALGTGIKYSPRELTVDAFRAESGEMELSLHGKWLDEFKQFTGRAIRVSSSVVKGHVLASCFIPESFFPPEQ